jgi:hypothetical protein
LIRRAAEHRSSSFPEARLSSPSAAQAARQKTRVMVGSWRINAHNWQPSGEFRLNSGEQSFFDEFQKYFYLGGMVLSMAGSAIALLVGHLNRKKSERDLRQINRLIELADKALGAQASELKALEEQLNGIIAWFGKGQASGAADSTAFSIAIAHARHAIERQRNTLRQGNRLRTSTRIVNHIVQNCRRRAFELVAWGDQAAIWNNDAIKMLSGIIFFAAAVFARGARSIIGRAPSARRQKRAELQRGG